MTKLYSMDKKRMQQIDQDPDLMDKLSSSKTSLLENLKGR